MRFCMVTCQRRVTLIRLCCQSRNEEGVYCISWVQAYRARLQNIKDLVIEGPYTDGVYLYYESSSNQVEIIIIYVTVC